MPSTAIDSQIHGCMFSTDEMREILSDKAWVQKWLDTEAALAAAQAELGVIPKEKADIINQYAKAHRHSEHRRILQELYYDRTPAESLQSNPSGKRRRIRALGSYESRHRGHRYCLVRKRCLRSHSS